MKKSIFLFFAAILCSVSAWAGPSFKGGYVYFHNKGGWNDTNKQLCIGKGTSGNSSYTSTYTMAAVKNTQLWYDDLPTSGWGDATYMAVIGNSSSWGAGNWGTSNLTNATHRTKSVSLGNWEFKSGHYQMLTPASGSNDATLSLDWVGDKISAMNKTITVKAKVSTDKGATYAEKTSPGTLTAGSFKFTDYKTCTTTTSLSSGEITCGYTANTTLTAQTDVEGYVFAGWYDDNGTRQTADATLTINPTADATYYAYYTAEPKHNVEITWVCGTTELQASQTVPVGEGTSYPVEAPKFKDYTFSGWTLGTGVTSADKTANPISITTKASGEYTLTANYTYIEPVIKTIYCKMEHGWWTGSDAAISAYASGTEGEMKSGLGTLMTLAPWESTVWKLDVDIARYQKVQFIRVSKDGLSDWNARTAVLDIPMDTKDLYTITQSTDMWYNGSYTCSGTWSTYTPAAVPDRYLTGNAAGFGMTIDGEGNEQWSPNTIKMTWNDATQKFTHTVSGLEANKYYKFRITDGTWAGKWGYSNLNPKVDNVFEAEDNNISFVLSAAGSITVAFDGTNIELTTSSSFAAPVYTIVGDETLMGGHWDLSSVENQMTHSSGSIYTLEKTVRIPAGEYEYKAVRNYSYDWEVPNNGGKNKVTIEKSGEGTIVYTLDIDKYELKHEIKNWEEKDLSNKVELYGIGENKTFTEATDRKTTSVAVELEANSVYTFEVVVNSVYYKNNGVMWRGNCDNWTFKSDENKAHIITDLAGTYTFTWTYEGNKLSVKYPDGTNVPAPVFLAGKMNNWERLATRLIPAADGTTASATVELERNVYNEFRMVVGTEDWTNTGKMDRGNCTGWTFDKVTEDNKNKDVNAGIKPDATGEYIFTWSYADNKLSVTYPGKPCTDCSSWYLCGSFNEWGLANEFTKVDDKTVTTTITLEAGEYKFKVQDMTDILDGKWWGSKQKITRDNTESTFEQKSGDEYNCTIVADIAGDYTFTWNTETKKLTVTCPEIIIGDGDNSSVLNSLNGKTVDLTVTRSFATGKLYTLALPFAMDNNAVTTIFGADVELYEFTALSEVNEELILNFTKQSTPAIVAGKPYLIKPKTTLSGGFEVKDATISNAIVSVPQACGNTTITMKSVLTANAEDETNGTSQYWLAADNNLYNNVVSIKGLRAIFDVQTSRSNVRARAAFNENVETGIDNIVTTDTPVKAIVNGQLIIIRDGVKYNVHGQKL